MSLKFRLQKILKWILISGVVGLLGGFAAAVFLHALNFATNYRDQHPWIIWFLPLGGALIGWSYHRYGKRTSEGTGLILEEIHDPSRTLPLRMAPMVFLGTVVTHLFGGSAGREGTAVQMGSTLADQLSSWFRFDSEERKILLVAGAGAGFSAAIGAPWAGALFGLEVVQIGRLRFHALFECLVSSFVAYGFCLWLQAPHSVFPEVVGVSYSLTSLAWAVVAGICFGLMANLFMQFTHFVEFLQKRFVKSPVLRPVVAGVLLVGLYHIEGSYRYVGLGIAYIQEALQTQVSWDTSFLKSFFTALTVGSGFKGGEFVPLVYVGTHLGSFLSGWIPLSLPLLGALGFAAVFGSAANTPWACAVMACEIFGWSLAPYALVTCWVAYFMTGHVGIYKNQRVVRSKCDQLLWIFQKRSKR